jgi:hypothetical protein
MRYVPLLVVALCPAGFSASGARNCIGSVPLATFQIKVSPGNGAAPLPIRVVNTIAKGYKLACTPVKVPPDLKKNARIALVVIPAGSASADGVTVLEQHTLDGTAEWTMPFTVGSALLVFGPQGLDEKRVTRLVSKDDDLVSELATYADQTEELEDTIDALAAIEDNGEDEADITPARVSPSDQVLFALTRALNPVLAAYNPLGVGRRAGPATRMGQATNMFFENAGGFVPGGEALPMVKTWLMPDTEFRTVYSEPAADDGLTLCAQRKTAGTHNRFVYLWAHRAVNSGPPPISLAQPAWLPAGARSTVPVKLKSIDDWPLVDRVRDWTLTGGSAPVPVKVRSDQRRLLELDLRKTAAQPGTYRLEGRWDWGTAKVDGEFHLASLADTKALSIAADSRGALVDGAGVVPLHLDGGDFQFVERVSIRKAGRLGSTPADLDYVLPVGLRAGPQPSMEVEIDTNHFRAGDYLLALAQTGGSTQTVPVRVLPAAPKIDNLPLRVNAGAKDLRLLLRGTGLDRLEGLTAEHATFRLGDINGEEREIFVSLDSGARKGDRFALQLALGGVPDAARISGGIVVVGVRPRIVSVKISPPQELATWLREGEVPAGSFVGMSIQVENADSQPALRLDCAESARVLEAVRVRSGERRAAAKLDYLGEGLLFASADPGVVGTPGCTLQVALDTESAGASDPVVVGRVIRLPRIESVTLTNETVDQGYVALLKGRDLEAIEKTGWTAANGLPVPGPPLSVAGEGDRQTLRVVLPWPSPTPMAPVFVWLRGDKEGRSVARR